MNIQLVYERARKETKRKFVKHFIKGRLNEQQMNRVIRDMDRAGLDFQIDFGDAPEYSALADRLGGLRERYYQILSEREL